MDAIAGFRLSEEIFCAGTTRVCRVVRIADSRSAVLKILSGEYIESEAFAQYRREFEITHSLGDIEGVIKVDGLENVQGTLMIVEEDIGGHSLDEILRKEPISLRDTLALAARIARILGEIHQRRVIHKDVTPANIVWNRTSDELRLIDFGIASQLSHERQEFQSVNQLEGNLAYISPEQTGRVNRILDHRSDLYSLGVTLYQLLTGALPFVSRQGIELVHAHIALTPPPPHELNPEIPLALSRIVMRLLSKMADERYQSAWGLEHDLQRCLDQWRDAGCVVAFPLAERDIPIRFQIPQKLYGRDGEIATIVAAFDRAAAGESELLLVKGGAGTGKTALVHEVHKPLTERRGSFISGKFDQYQRDIPFFAWTQAFEQFCDLLLKEDEASLARWRERISAALGGIGKAVADVIPSIELIVGKQPDVPPLSGEQALNRLNHAFGNLLAAICRKEHPLVVFIDDWQWADAGSLSLLKSALERKEIRHLLLVGAYRDNEVHAAHPFAMALDEITKSRAKIDAIALQGLQPNDVRRLVKDTLNDSPGVDDLARLAYDKTRGNAFFLIQLLHDLYAKSIIAYNAADRRWVWRQDEIESQSIADNVVDLMTGKIRQLPENTQNALIDASCIGDRFDLITLAAILGKPAHALADDLEPALREGILLPIGHGYRVAKQEDHAGNAVYQFIHDRVRQAAYSMLDQSAATRNHLDIARLWLAELGPAEQEARIFDIANQYNAGRGYVADAHEKYALLAINLRAGKRAKNSAAYATALHYFRAALELQSADCWLDQPARGAELHLLAAEAAFLGKDYASMEEWAEEFLRHVDAPLERVKVLKVRLQAYVAQNRLSEAVDVALHALGLLGIDLPKSPPQQLVVEKLVETKQALEGKTLAGLLDLPAMTDPAKLAAMDLLGLLIPPAYWTSQALTALTVFQMVRESVAHGHSPNAGYGFSWWGIIESAMLGNIDAGCEFGEFAIDLARKHNLNLQQPLFFAAWIIRKFKHPLKDSIPVFEQTYALSLEKGDFEYASYARNNVIQAQFHTGRGLDELLPEMERAHGDLLRFQVGSSLYWHDICWQTALNFAGNVADPQHLGGPAYDETASLPQHLKVNDASTLFLLYCAKLMLSCFFNQRTEALDNAAKARIYQQGGVGMHAHVLFHFHESLALLADLDGADGSLRRRRLRAVAANQKNLKKWADSAPANYGQHWLLIEAERMRVSGRTEQALRYFDQAIDRAHENGFVHEEALAHELAARCQLQAGRERLAAYYLKQALQLYERWGAAAKAAQLMAEFPRFLLTHAQGSEPHRTATHPNSTAGSSGILHSNAFDISAITAASQAISSEIVIDNLVATVLKIVIEHAGAQKAFLILKNGGELNIEAQGLAGQDIAITVQTVAIDNRDELPLARSMVQYVARTGKSLVVHDARQDLQFARDPYILRAQPLSVLCQPIIQQGKLIGMLYLENNLTVGAFTEERLELLRLLTSQAAISIENANLYRHLEHKVEERTQKLQASLDAQEHLNAELHASSLQLEKAHAQLREINLLLQQQADTDGLTGLANRRVFNERLRYEIDRCARAGQPLALILCDLDNFKRFNDAYGHVAGDDCLKRTARQIQSTFTRATDLVARYGGEEFVVLLPMVTAQQAAALGEAMRAAVAALEIPHGGNGAHGIVTLSAGCHACIPVEATDPTDIIGKADAALYQAKDLGRNRLVQSD
ncbi:MAG: putative ATPase [Proteobacteria bacterium]|nr:putative ATPase [Pseudomonadota bacterium]